MYCGRCYNQKCRFSSQSCLIGDGFFLAFDFFFSTWEILSIYGVVPAQIPKSISKMLVRWCLPHKVCRFPTLRCWVTAGVNWVTAQWTPRLQCSDWGLLLFLSSQMTWKNMKNLWQSWNIHHFQMVSPFQKHQKSMHICQFDVNIPLDSVADESLVKYWERTCWSPCAQDPIGGPYLSYFGRKTPRIWPGGPLVLKHGLLENAPLIISQL